MIAPATAHFPTTVQSAMFRRGNNNLVSFPLHHRQKEKQQFELPLGSARLGSTQRNCCFRRVVVQQHYFLTADVISFFFSSLRLLHLILGDSFPSNCRHCCCCLKLLYYLSGKVCWTWFRYFSLFSLLVIELSVQCSTNNNKHIHYLSFSTGADMTVFLSFLSLQSPRSNSLKCPTICYSTTISLLLLSKKKMPTR